MQLIDTIMMGWIDPLALAAGALGTSIFTTSLLFCMGTLSSVGIFISRARGAGDEHDIKVSVLHGICLALFLSLPCMFIIWFSPYLLLMIGESPRIVENTNQFLHGLVWGFPGFLLFLVFREFISAFSLTLAVMLVALASIPLTILANYVLIYGKYGLPKLGIAGIGYSGAMIMWFMFICLLIYSRSHAYTKPYISFKYFNFDKAKMLDMIYIGIPSGLLLLLESAMFLMSAVFMGYFGVDALAAHQIAIQCGSIAYAIPFALAMATALQVGHAVGAKNYLQAKRYAMYGLIIGLIVMGILSLIFIFASEKLIHLFLPINTFHFKEISQMTASFLMLVAFFQLFDATQGIANGALRGLRDTFVPMLISSACYWLLGVSSAYIFSFYLNLGPKGVWYGLALAFSSAGVILLIRLFKKLNHQSKEC